MPLDTLHHYRALYVQPDAPPEVIKAAWRALMSVRRVHPDLGGNHDEAARLNAAYEVLGDPARRAAYDRQRRAPTRERTGDPSKPQGSRRQATAAADKTRSVDPKGTTCPFCQRLHPSMPQRDSRCTGCGSPLMPLPSRAQRSAGEDRKPSRRSEPRFPRDVKVEIWLPAEEKPRSAHLLDLSFSGLQLQASEPLSNGQVARVVAPWFEALICVVNSRRVSNGHALHGRLLTLLLAQQARGVYVDSRA